MPQARVGVGRNYIKTGMLMAFLIALLAIGGNVWGGYQGMMLFGFIGLAFNFASYWFSDRIALMMHRAQEVSREQQPQVYEIVERLWRDDLADLTDERRALDRIKQTLAAYFHVAEEIEEAVRAKLKTKVPGSRDWDILYRKFYEEEASKRR